MPTMSGHDDMGNSLNPWVWFRCNNDQFLFIIITMMGSGLFCKSVNPLLMVKV